MLNKTEFQVFLYTILLSLLLFINDYCNVKASELAKQGQFPWNVLIDIETEGVPNEHYNCTGTLISKKWVITAAHCLEETKNVICNFGLTERSKPKLQISSSEFIKHPRFDSYNDWDIALIKLSKKVQFTNDIQPISLPKNTMTYERLMGKICTVPGFERGQGSSKNLKFSKFQIIPRDSCLLSLFDVMTYGSMCALNLGKTNQNQNKNFCVRDFDGSGLVLDYDNRFYLIGIGSLQFTTKCDKNHRVVFQSIQTNLNWISRITGYGTRSKRNY